MRHSTNHSERPSLGRSAQLCRAPDLYFASADDEQYVKKAAFLTQLVFSGDAKRAHQLYATQFQEQVKVEQLAKLSETLKQRFGNEIRKMELKKTQLSNTTSPRKAAC